MAVFFVLTAIFLFYDMLFDWKQCGIFLNDCWKTTSLSSEVFI